MKFYVSCRASINSQLVNRISEQSFDLQRQFHEEEIIVTHNELNPTTIEFRNSELLLESVDIDLDVRQK